MNSIVTRSSYFAPSGRSADRGFNPQGVALGCHILAFQAERLHGRRLLAGPTGAAASLALVILIALVPCDRVQAADRQRHWAFEPLQRIKSPPAEDGASDHPIDRLIRTELARHDLKPQPQADKRTLIRRVTFDLVGLPPAPEEIDAFLTDDSPEAWSRVVDRLLASPQYGERWGRHWLDVVRYADTGGFEADYLYASAWKYRDYVIRSLNSDKPFDRFLQEQTANPPVSA